MRGFLVFHVTAPLLLLVVAFAMSVPRGCGATSESTPMPRPGDSAVVHMVTEEPEMRHQRELAEQEKEDAFVQWLRDGGARFEDVAIAPFQSTGRGLKALRTLPAETELMWVPNELCLTETAAWMSNIGVQAHKAIRDANKNKWLQLPDVSRVLAVFLMREAADPESIYRPWLDVLPTHEGSPLYWAQEDLSLVLGLPIVESARHLEARIRHDYKAVFGQLFRDEPALFPRDVFTLDRWRWALMTLWARMWDVTGLLPVRVSASMVSSPKYYVREAAIIPLADMVNFRQHKTVAGLRAAIADPFSLNATGALRVRQVGDGYTVHTTSKWRAGRQIFDLLPPHTPSELLLFHAFMPPHGPYYFDVAYPFDSRVLREHCAECQGAAVADRKHALLHMSGVLPPAFHLVSSGPEEETNDERVVTVPQELINAVRLELAEPDEWLNGTVAEGVLRNGTSLGRANDRRVYELIFSLIKQQVNAFSKLEVGGRALEEQDVVGSLEAKYLPVNTLNALKMRLGLKSVLHDALVSLARDYRLVPRGYHSRRAHQDTALRMDL